VEGRQVARFACQAGGDIVIGSDAHDCHACVLQPLFTLMHQHELLESLACHRIHSQVCGLELQLRKWVFPCGGAGQSLTTLLEAE
jgi:hypothetical protein